MNSAIAIFFASLVSGALSLADFRPAAADVLQILTGVELAPQETTSKDQKQQVYGAPITKPESNSCKTASSKQKGNRTPACCQV